MLRRGVVFESNVRCGVISAFSIVRLLLKENRSLFHTLFVISVNPLARLIVTIDQSMTEQKIFALFPANYSTRSQCCRLFVALTWKIIKPNKNSECYFFSCFDDRNFFRTIDYTIDGKRGNKEKEDEETATGRDNSCFT